MSLLTDRQRLKANANKSEADLLRSALAESTALIADYTKTIDKRFDKYEKKDEELVRAIKKAIQDGVLLSLKPVEQRLLELNSKTNTNFEERSKHVLGRYSSIANGINNNAKITWFLIAVFTCSLAFVGWQLGNIKQTAKETNTLVDYALYNKAGYSVLNGAKGSQP